MTAKLTDAQLRALIWLTPEWQKLTAAHSAAVTSLCYHPNSRGLCAVRRGPHGPRGGWMTQARLTAAGADEKVRRLAT